MQTYVDEDSIYLCNIFEEKKLNKLKNSRSDENMLGRLSKKLGRTVNNNRSNFYNNFSHLSN